jgi:hypothetical protein
LGWFWNGIWRFLSGFEVVLEWFWSGFWTAFWAGFLRGKELARGFGVSFDAHFLGLIGRVYARL